MSAYDLVFKLDTISNLFTKEGIDLQLNGLTEETQKKIEAIIGEGREGEVVIGISTDKIKEINELLFKKYDSLVRVSVLGLFNRGKTFLLNELCGVNHDSSNKVHTEGISISIPANGEIMIIDSAGMNVPLTKEFLDFEKAHFGEFKPEIEVDGNLSEFGKHEEQMKLKEIEEANYHSELTHFAIVRKKNTEVYIQKTIFQLSNVIIIVVNEMTWADQQYISSVMLNISKIDTKYGEVKLFVVHNYKTAENMDDLKTLRRMYVTDVYHGQMKTTQEGAEIFEESRSGIRHVFLCKHNSEAGKFINRKSLNFLLTNVVAGNFSVSIRRNFLNEFLRVNEERMSEIIRNPGPKLELCWNKSKKNFSLRSATKEAPMYILPTIDITPDSMMVLKSNDFLIEVDQITDETSLILCVDLPGFSNDDLKSKNTNISIIVDRINYTITVTGERKLKFHSYHPGVGNFGTFVHYSEHKYTNVTFERTYGRFKREFIIPRQYDINLMQQSIQNGELTLIFPLRQLSQVEFEV